MPGADTGGDCTVTGVPRRIAYTAAGWGEGELWLDGDVPVWHESPRGAADEDRADHPLTERLVAFYRGRGRLVRRRAGVLGGGDRAGSRARRGAAGGSARRGGLVRRAGRARRPAARTARCGHVLRRTIACPSSCPATGSSRRTGSAATAAWASTTSAACSLSRAFPSPDIRLGLSIPSPAVLSSTCRIGHTRSRAGLRSSGIGFRPRPMPRSGARFNWRGRSSSELPLRPAPFLAGRLPHACRRLRREKGAGPCDRCALFEGGDPPSSYPLRLGRATRMCKRCRAGLRSSGIGFRRRPMPRSGARFNWRGRSSSELPLRPAPFLAANAPACMRQPAREKRDGSL